MLQLTQWFQSLGQLDQDRITGVMYIFIFFVTVFVGVGISKIVKKTRM